MAVLWVKCRGRYAVDKDQIDTVYIIILKLDCSPRDKPFDKATFCAFHLQPTLQDLLRNDCHSLQCELSELNCPCLAAASHLSACLALNCHKMQFCTLLLRQHSNTGLVCSAFSRKGDDSSRGSKLDGAQKD